MKTHRHSIQPGKALLIASALIGTSVLAFAEPLPKPVAPNTKWQISFSYGDMVSQSEKAIPSARSSDSRPIQTTVVKMPGYLYEETHTVGGQVFRRWRKGHLEVLQEGDGGPFTILDTQNLLDERTSLYHLNDFPDLRWISQADPKGTESLGGRECVVFRDKVIPDVRQREGELPIIPDAIETTAYLDAASGLPVMWRNAAGVMAKYVFTPISSAPEIPAEARVLFALNEPRPAPGRPLRP